MLVKLFEKYLIQKHKCFNVYTRRLNRIKLVNHGLPNTIRLRHKQQLSKSNGNTPV